MDAVVRLRDDCVLYQALRDSGRNFVLQKFSRDAFATKYLHLIQKRRCEVAAIRKADEFLQPDLAQVGFCF